MKVIAAGLVGEHTLHEKAGDPIPPSIAAASRPPSDERVELVKCEILHVDPCQVGADRPAADLPKAPLIDVPFRQAAK
jgi:hypothetical protein